MVEQATLAARSDARVLLTGESGTGKELLAAHIHRESPFASGPFVKVNCAAIPTELHRERIVRTRERRLHRRRRRPPRKIRARRRRHLFLDEVGDLHAASQAKLLRVLQEGEFHRVGGEHPIRVNVRVISATNRELADLVSQQKFREDLYYRLCVVPIRVPPLRQRLMMFASWPSISWPIFAARNNFKPKTIDDEVYPVLEDYAWPGNARELRNTVERMAILTPGNVLTLEAVPIEIRLARGNAPKSNLREARDSAESEHILRALEESSWNVSSAARALGMERTNLHKRIRALGLSRPPHSTV